MTVHGTSFVISTKSSGMIRFSVLFLSFISFVGFTQVQTAIQNLVNRGEFSNASISIQVNNLTTKQAVASYNPNTCLPPASTMKLFSTATSLTMLGKNYRPKTELYCQGTISDSILYGKIMVKGYGDPTLGSMYFDKPMDSVFGEWQKALLKKGIKGLNGEILIDGSQFGYHGNPDGWTWGDMGNYYGSGPSGICAYDNILSYFFRTTAAGSPSQLIRTEPDYYSLEFFNQVVAANVKGDNSYIFGAPYSNVRFATGTLPTYQNEFKVKGSLPDPELALGKSFESYLRNHLFSLQGEVKTARQELWDGKLIIYDWGAQLVTTTQGRSLLEIATLTNHKSINLFAEQLVCLTGFEMKRDGSTDSGLDVLENYWKSKISWEGIRITDGSGLSRSNAVSADQFCDLLGFMFDSQFEDFKSTLPIAGKTGTMSGLCKGTVAEGRVYAKSGTMNRIKSYAGYVQGKSGNWYSFAIILNNYNCSNASAVDSIEKIMVAIANN